MGEPTNGVLLEKIESLRELMDYQFEEHGRYHMDIRGRLDSLNGQVALNTKFREKWKTIFAILGISVAVVGPIIQAVAVKSFNL